MQSEEVCIMPFDIYCKTAIGRMFIQTEDDEDTASKICRKNNITMTPEQIAVGWGHMYYIES